MGILGIEPIKKTKDIRKRTPKTGRQVAMALRWYLEPKWLRCAEALIVGATLGVGLATLKKIERRIKVFLLSTGLLALKKN